MDFEKSIKRIIKSFEKEKVGYALIGGFALGLYGITRTTIDLDFIVDYRKNELVKQFFVGDYKIYHETDNVLQLMPKNKENCGVDIIWAKRALGRGIIHRAEVIDVFDRGVSIKVARLEDIIGLKLQALVNDGRRYIKERYDIEFIMEKYKKKLDWEMIKEYFEMFNKIDDYVELKKRYAN